MGHDEHQCLYKQIDELKNIMKKHNVPLPKAYMERGSSSLDSKGKGHALLTNTVSHGEWIIDSGATHHMGASKRDFSSMTHLKVPDIFIGDDTKVEVEGIGEVEMDNGAFKDGLYVHNLTSNLLLVYQITHYGGGNKVEFLPDSMVVKSIKEESIIAIGEANHDSRIYTFSSFVPK